jgi:hypothetical protein
MVHIVRVITCMRCKSIANRADSSHVEVSFIYGRWFTSNAWPKPHLKDNDMQSFQSWGFYAQQIWLIRHIIRAQNAQLHVYELERPVSMSEPCSSALPPTPSTQNAQCKNIPWLINKTRTVLMRIQMNCGCIVLLDDHLPAHFQHPDRLLCTRSGLEKVISTPPLIYQGNSFCSTRLFYLKFMRQPIFSSQHIRCQ